MNILSKYGINGAKLWLGIEWRHDGPFPTMILQSRKGEVRIVEREILQSKEELYTFVRKYPAIPVLIYLPEALGIEKCIPLQTERVVSTAMGVQVDHSSDYIWQSIPTHDGFQWVKILRKEELEELLEEWGKLNERIIGLSFSKASMCFLIPGLMDYQKDQHYELEKEFYWQEQLISTPTQHTRSISIGDLAYSFNLDKIYIPLYGAMFHNFLAVGRDIHQFPALEERRKNFSINSKWLKSLAIAFGLLVVLALAARLEQDLFRIRAESGNQVLASSAFLLQSMDKNQQEIEAKSSFFQQKSLQLSKSSLYLDRLASLRPEGLNFSTLVFHASEERLKKMSDDLIIADSDIVLQGNAIQVDLIRKLVFELERQDWVEKAVLWKSAYDFRERQQSFILSIKING
ncbi:MAG: hypothetical protein MRZ79_08025 [Bacteroidia bacterium]|nr:hypothetical protein [Bacteroidia bacterium]